MVKSSMSRIMRNDRRPEELDLTSAEMQEGTRISPRTWVLLAAALFFLLLSVFLGTSIKDIVNDPWRTAADVAREVGFALGIAFVVILAVEVSSRREFHETIHQRIQKFSGTYSHPPFSGMFQTRLSLR
jgi:hypothetical protein